MSSLISDLQKLQYENALFQVFETFSISIYIYKAPETIIVATDETAFNFIYNNSQPAVQTTQTFVSGVFPGSVNWGEPNAFNLKELRPNIDGSICQLDLTNEGYNFLTGYEQIIVDGVSCSINAENPYPKMHGLFDTTKYKCMYLRRNN